MTAAVKSKTNRSERIETMEAVVREIVAQGKAHAAELDKAIARVNELVGKADSSLDAASNILFEAAWEGDVHAALGAAPRPSVALNYLLDAANNGALKLETSMVRRAIRVGAVNRKLAGTAWSALGYSLKVALLPLQSDPSDFHGLQEGARFAGQPGTSVRALREWVAQRVGNVDTDTSDAVSPTAAVSAKALAVGSQLGSGQQRELWVLRGLSMPPAARRQHLEQLKAAAQNFDAIAKSLEAAMAALSG
jgi:hypothetical protein